MPLCIDEPRTWTFLSNDWSVRICRRALSDQNNANLCSSWKCLLQPPDILFCCVFNNAGKWVSADCTSALPRGPRTILGSLPTVKNVDNVGSVALLSVGMTPARTPDAAIMIGKVEIGCPLLPLLNRNQNKLFPQKIELLFSGQLADFQAFCWLIIIPLSYWISLLLLSRDGGRCNSFHFLV